MRVKDIHATIPAKGWYALMGKHVVRIPVEAWCFATIEEGPDADPDISQVWLGLGIWKDGPDFFESMGDFKDYDRWSRE